MRWSAEKLRWLSLGGALLLAVVVAAFFGLAHFRMGKVWQRILARNGMRFARETNGYTFSESRGGRTVFTLHAAKAVPNGTGHWSLHDAVLILYGKNNHNDRIYGSEFEYDQEQGIARAVGVVHMDLQVPEPAGTGKPGSGKGLRPGTANDLSFLTGDAAAGDPAMIHVQTSGLVYLRRLGTATTDQETEFQYKGLRCTSRGAAFDSDRSLLHLLADVHMDGTLRDTAFALVADTADLDRGSNVVQLSHPRLRSGERSGQADEATVHLRSDGSLEAGQAQGAVEMHSGTEMLGSPAVAAQFGAADRPERVVFTGGAHFVDTDGARPTQGKAERLTLLMNNSGLLQTAMAEGAATLHVQEPLGTGGPRAGPIATRALAAQVITASFGTQKGRSQPVLQRLHMSGAAQAEEETPSQGGAPGPGRGPSGASMRVQADELTTEFVLDNRGKAAPARMTGTGHTQLQQAGVDGAHQESFADRLEANFTETDRRGEGHEALAVASAVQSGHAVLRAWPAERPNRQAGTADRAETPTVAHAERAVFEGGAGTLTLTATGGERAEVTDGATVVQAPTIVLHQGTGDGEASGGVRATTTGTGEAPASHVLAAMAHLLRRTNVTEFFGSDAVPVQLWQGSSQVEAARLVLDGQHHTLAARPETTTGAVHAVFANEGAGDAKRAGGASAALGTQGRQGVQGESRTHATTGLAGVGGPATPASRDAVQVTAAALDFNDLKHEADFTGHVQLRMPEGEMTGDRGVAFLHPGGTVTGGKPGTVGDMSGKVDRMVMLGDVRLMQPGRLGTGTQLTYTAASDEFVLTGSAATPPRVRDVQQGMVTGATLIFKAAGKAGGTGGERSLVVAGTEGVGMKTGGTNVAGNKVAGNGVAGKPGGRVRVHTETDVKP